MQLPGNFYLGQLKWSWAVVRVGTGSQGAQEAAENVHVPVLSPAGPAWDPLAQAWSSPAEQGAARIH